MITLITAAPTTGGTKGLFIFIIIIIQIIMAIYLICFSKRHASKFSKKNKDSMQNETQEIDKTDDENTSL